MKIVKSVVSPWDFNHVKKTKEFYHTELVKTGISTEFITYEFREFFPNGKSDNKSGQYGKYVTYKEYLEQTENISCNCKNSKPYHSIVANTITCSKCLKKI